MPGKLYLIPVTLGGTDHEYVIPGKVTGITRQLRHFIVENIRTARRYLRMIDKDFPIDGTVFFELNEHTRYDELASFLEPLTKGLDLGLMSEAGLPCLADPGSKIVALAHAGNIQVVPLSGPSSIILALISSGMNGQNFTFNGYLPVKPAERSVKIRELQKRAREGYSQIFMETPYRSQKMLQSLADVCDSETKLCIALDISLPGESIRTLRIGEWKKSLPRIEGRLAVFVLG